MSPSPCRCSLSIILRSSICRIQTQIGEAGRSLHQPVGLDIRHGHQTVLSGSDSSPLQESPRSPKAEVEQVAKIEEVSPELTTNVSPPANYEAPRGKNTAIGKQTASLMASIVDKTQHAIVTHDRSLYQHLAQIYRELGENRTQIQLLTDAIAQPQRGKSTPLPNTLTVLNDVGDHVSANDDQSNLSEDNHSDATEIFLDCVSRFSQRSEESIDRLNSMFSGSPDYIFEATSTFFPEQYTTEGLFNEPTAVLAMVELDYTKNSRLHKYFLIHAETPRRWQRVTVLAQINCNSEHTTFSRLSAPDFLEHSCKTLPAGFQSRLEKLLHSRKLLETITRVSMHITEDDRGKCSFDDSAVLFSEDVEESEMCNEVDRLQDIEDLGCAQYLESEIIVQARISSSAYIVLVESQSCIERKLPFAGAGLPGQNGIDEYFDDLRLLYSLRHCACIVHFIGVVLDDNRQHFKGYLYESPTLGTVQQILETAEAKAEQIPWTVRETWAKQIVTAISEVHSSGFVVGVLQLDSIGVRADGSAVLTALKTSGRHLPNRRGYVPPELRSQSGDAPSQKKMTFRTDIFQLGFILWLLAEHKSTVCGYYCVRNGCTTIPRYSCTADHTNPVGLPSCLKGIPAYFNGIISNCRASDPKARLPARELLASFPKGADMTSISAEMAKLGAKYPITDCVRFSVNCDECGALTTDVHYHCYICNLADFDLCHSCVAQGIHCFEPEHHLTKRILKNGSIVNAA